MTTNDPYYSEGQGKFGAGLAHRVDWLFLAPVSSSTGAHPCRA